MKKNIFVYTVFTASLSIFFACEDNTFSRGKDTYIANCANCHMEDGSGLAGLIPPLAKADFLLKNKEQIACIIKKGLQGDIIVNGKTYNQGMAGVANLSDADIANITNYVLNAWGNQGGTFDFKTVKQQLQDCEEK